MGQTGFLSWDGTNDLGKPEMLGIYIITGTLFHPDGQVIRIKKIVYLPILLTNFTDLISAILKTLLNHRLVHYGFMLTMLLFIALIIAGPEVLFVRQLSAYLLHIMLGLFALGFLFLFTGFEKLMLMSFAACAVLCVFIKNQSNGELIYPKDNYTEKKISVCHQPQQCV